MFNFRDLKYLFKRSVDDSKNVYRQDLENNRKTIEKISLYNSGFSETLFTSWVNNIFLRYILYCSDNLSSEKLNSFESLHLKPNGIPSWRSELGLYDKFNSIKIKFVDFIDFNHTKESDKITLKLCLICSKSGENISLTDLDEEMILYYNVVFEKNNDMDEMKNNTINYTSNCPYCGAPTDIATFGECGYCGEFVSIYDNVWKIRNISVSE